MAEQLKNITGKSLTVRRKANNAQVRPYDLLASGKTKAIQFVNELGETTSHDPNAPNDAPWRTSLIASRSWTVNISGALDLKRLALLRADATAAVEPVVYALEFAGTKADGGGTIEGGVWVENLQVQSQNLGVAEFTCQLRGDGAPIWTDAAA